MTAITKLQQKIDELIVQLDLGKMEAVQKVEEAKEDLHSALNRIRRSKETAKEALQEDLGHVQLQLKLGKMESRDAYFEQKQKIEKSVHRAAQSLKKCEHHAEDEFHDAAENLIDRIHVLGFNLALAGEIAVDEVQETKAKVKAKLAGVGEELREVGDHAEASAGEVVKESKAALADIRSNLSTLFKSA
ncbi:MAG: hypothetical protein P1U89_20025 [Verrucomicrobiales bacterium]|nr:hypothetical protein [Verrucomicrobiales bacterium]